MGIVTFILTSLSRTQRPVTALLNGCEDGLTAAESLASKEPQVTLFGVGLFTGTLYKKLG